MDVNQNTVVESMEKENVQYLIHGHVHKPGVHSLEVNGVAAHRYVLGEWDDGADGVVTCTLKENRPVFELHAP